MVLDTATAARNGVHNKIHNIQKPHWSLA